MREKDESKILEDLNKIIKDKLSNNFKNRKHRLVVKIEDIQLLDYKIYPDENNRDQVLVSNVYVKARVYVEFGHDATSSDDIILKNQNSIKFNYNRNIDNFEIDKNTAVFYDATPH